MVAEAEGADEKPVKHLPFNLYDREFVYTLPSGEEVIISPHNDSRGMAIFPEGTGVKVRKVKREAEE